MIRLIKWLPKSYNKHMHKMHYGDGDWISDFIKQLYSIKQPEVVCIVS